MTNEGRVANECKNRMFIPAPLLNMLLLFAVGQLGLPALLSLFHQHAANDQLLKLGYKSAAPLSHSSMLISCHVSIFQLALCPSVGVPPLPNRVVNSLPVSPSHVAPQPFLNSTFLLSLFTLPFPPALIFHSHNFCKKISFNWLFPGPLHQYHTQLALRRGRAKKRASRGGGRGRASSRWSSCEIASRAGLFFFYFTSLQLTPN